MTHVCNWHQKSRTWPLRKMCATVPMGEPLRRLCVRDMTLKCNTRRARLVVTSVTIGWVQFDSDYSVEDGASPIFLSRSVTTVPMKERILLIVISIYGMEL